MARPVKAAVEEASREPWETLKLAATDEEALAAKPPKTSRVNKVVEAKFWTTRAATSPLEELVAVIKVRIVEEAALVEVAAMVATERASGVVVPIESKSVSVTNLTTRPSSRKPEESETEAAAAQAGKPLDTAST